MSNHEKMPTKTDLHDHLIKMQKETEYGYTEGKKTFNFIEKDGGSDEEE